MSFLAVCVNPTLQKTLCFNRILPGKVNRAGANRLDVSGKGVNVARVLSQLGKKVIHLTHLGGELKEFFLSLCREDGLELSWVEGGSPIRFCYTLISGDDGRLITELVEEGAPVAEGTEEKLLARYRELLPETGTVIISGTKAKGYSGALIPEMTRLARENGKRIILDVRGNDLIASLEYNPDIIKPNLFEFTDTFAPEFKTYGELSGDEPGVKERIREIALELCARHQTGITLSRGGDSVWFFRDSVSGEIPVRKINPVNPIGSGDAFTAGLAAALEDGLPFGEAVARGIDCGSRNAAFLKPGVIQEQASEISSV